LELDPERLRRWYESQLGARVDLEEKRIVFALAELRPGERVLDLGCGDGNYTLPAAQRTGGTVGLDRSAPMLRAARLRLDGVSGIEWVCGDAVMLPFPDGSFDAVIAVTLLCFASDPEGVVNEAFRVLRPGTGRLVLGELGRYSAWAMIRRLRGLLGASAWRAAHFFSRREMESHLRYAGFQNLSVRAGVFSPPVKRLAILRVLRPFGAVGRRCTLGRGFPRGARVPSPQHGLWIG
jgi:ubiquinone/menaquinone biosynthesis C-methylase UbiE